MELIRKSLITHAYTHTLLPKLIHLTHPSFFLHLLPSTCPRYQLVGTH